jgi:predicted DNA-binding transcriptional regulator YafY
MAESRGGLTLDEMADHLGVSRRTSERLRNALDQVTGGLISTATEEGHKRWKLPTGKFNAFTTPTMDELAGLKLAASRLRQEGSLIDAKRLESLALKLESSLPRSTMRRLEPDIEALLEATGVVVRPGPKANVDPAIAATLRDAILSTHEVRLRYRRRDDGTLSRPRVRPCGVLSGSRDYLVGYNNHPQVREYRLYVLSNIEEIEVTSISFERDPDFDLRAFAARSFGVFWDGQYFDVEWRFKPDVAEDARRFRFHPDQTVVDRPDGSVVVTFRASGLTEMAWHLFTWGEGVEIIRPAELKERYHEWLQFGLSVTADNGSERE